VPTKPELTLGEQCCLALIGQGATHGWAVGTLLESDGEIGRIWSLSRPLTYRAIDTLVERRLVSRRDAVAGRGRERRLLRATATGRRTTAAWLDAPVTHIRDVRTELLVKLALRQRAGLPVEPLLAAEQRVLVPTIDALTAGTPADDDLVDVWRRESARAVRRFLDSALTPPPPKEVPEMRLSARNQLRATVTAVVHGEVMSTVKVTLAAPPDGQQLTAAITKDAALDLAVAPGDEVLVIVKSTEVMVAKPD
jgi:PadR family transcriptional regulator AphA